MGEWIDIASPQLSASINPFGAELSSLKDAGGRELMTDADPAFWTGRAPILFPIVGRLNGDALRIDGVDYPLEKHGFARRRMFDLAERSDSHMLLRLVDSEDTRQMYPFRFLLEIGFTVAGATLAMTARIGNIGDEPMPVSFGWHPAFAWPLPYGAPREEHRIVFQHDEPGTLRGLNADGLIAADRPTPVQGDTLMLADALFENDALIWDPVHSQRLLYGPANGPALDIAFPDTPRLGIWTRPGARYVCIEPWHGIADSAGFDGDFRQKPGVVAVDPGATWQCAMHVTLTA